MNIPQRLRQLAASTGLDGFAHELRAIADEMEAQPADVTDEQINAVALEQWGPHAGGPLAAHRAFARAIIALRPAQVAVPMTDEQRLASWFGSPVDMSWAAEDAYAQGISDAEAHHGITAQAKKEDE